jgi:hypothetical protein
MVQEGVMRRSELEFSDVTWRGISPAVCMLMVDITLPSGFRNSKVRGTAGLLNLTSIDYYWAVESQITGAPDALLPSPFDAGNQCPCQLAGFAGRHGPLKIIIQQDLSFKFFHRTRNYEVGTCLCLTLEA